MAEIGLVASVAQIADTGIKLSITLYTFAETVLTADKSIREIASDVSLTSSVLEELGQNLKKDQKSRLCSENAVKTAEGIVKECATIFNEINGTLETTLEKIKPRAGSEKGNGRDGTHAGRKMAVAALERLKWPFLQPKMQLLRSNLDRLKSTLVLMLNVITYARKVSEDHATPSTLEGQRKLIEDLARSNQEYTRKFKELTKAIEVGQNHLEAVKPIPAMENVPSSGFLQANMVLPPSESVHVAGQTSPDITSRLTTLAKQHLPPDAGGQSDELAHYCLLINHLLQRIDAVQYKIKSDLRRRIRSDVVHMHQREADQLKDVHGRRHFTTIMGSAISWAEILHPTEYGASRTSRDLIHPDWSERDWDSLNALLERGDDLALPGFPSTSISGIERRAEPAQLEKRVQRMISLEGLMRQRTHKRAAGASYRTRRKPERLTVHGLEVPLRAKKRVVQPGFTSMELLRGGAIASEADAELQTDARQLLSQKSDNVDYAAMLHSGGRPGSRSPHSEVDDLTINTTTIKLPLRDSSRPTTPSSRLNSDLKLREPGLLKRKYDAGDEFSYGETNTTPTSNPLGQERARVKKALDDRRHNSLSMMIFSEAEGSGEGSGILLAGDLQILEALTSIRDKILEVATLEQMATRSRPTGSASEIAEDAILTAQKLWRSVQLIHENTHGHIFPADRVRAVARLVDLLLESARVKAKAWKGLTDIDRKIDRILDGRETRDEAIARREILCKASKKFALLTTSQRHALQEAWSPETKYKENIQKGWKQVQRLSRSITSLSTPKRREAQEAVVEQHSVSTPLPAEYPTVFELPADGESNLRVQLDAPVRTIGAEKSYDHPGTTQRTPPYPLSNWQRSRSPRPSTGAWSAEDDEVLLNARAQQLSWAPLAQRYFPNRTGNACRKRHERFLEKSEALESESVRANWSNGTLSQGNSDDRRSTETSSILEFEEAYSEDLSNLGSWADESTGALPGPRRKAEDAKPEHKVYADNMSGSDDYIEPAACARDDTDYKPQGIMPPVTRPQTPDIVDDLLAEWTTLPR